jgi:hypothetical protein
MKKVLLLPITIILTILLSAITVVFAVDKQEQNESISKTLNESINKEKVDVTGDGKADLVTIKGTPYEEGTLFLKDITLKVKTSEGKSFKIELAEGYDPTINVNDLNHDGVKDLFISMQTGGSGNLSNYYLYTFKDSKKEDLSVPDSLAISSQYEDGYKASIKIDETGKTYIFNLSDRKKNYDKLGLYNEGKLNEPMELMVFPFSTLKSVKLEGAKLGLKGIQRFSGASNADTIGFVESSWIFENGSWNLLDTSVQKIMDTKKKR